MISSHCIPLCSDFTPNCYATGLNTLTSIRAMPFKGLPSSLAKRFNPEISRDIHVLDPVSFSFVMPCMPICPSFIQVLLFARPRLASAFDPMIVCDLFDLRSRRDIPGPIESKAVATSSSTLKASKNVTGVFNTQQLPFKIVSRSPIALALPTLCLIKGHL